MKHIIKKRRKRRVLLFLIIITLTVTVAFNLKNKNVSYIAQDVLCHVGNSVNLKSEKFEKVTTYTVEELKNKENVVFNNSLILVNKENLLSENFEADTKYLKERDVYLDKYAAEHFNELESDVQSIFNETLFISSA